MSQPTDAELETLRSAVALVRCDLLGDFEGGRALWEGAEDAEALGFAVVSLARAAMAHLAAHLDISVEQALDTLTVSLLP